MDTLIQHWEAVLIGMTFLSLVFFEWAIGLNKSHSRKKDHSWIDFISLAQLAILIKPLIFLLIGSALIYLAPELAGTLEGLPFWLGFAIVFLPDDFTHYWYHRLAHEKQWMWPWHRTHHSTPTYQASIAFRENWAWFWFMPGIWWSGSMVYFGLVEQVALSTAIIGIHNTLIHNGFTFDTRLYRSRLGRNIMAAFEIFIQTPSLHRGHHGLGKNGVPMGNYGQTLFIWDVIFGTAQFKKNKVPERYGIYKGGDEPWYQQLWRPYAYKKVKCGLKSSILPQKRNCCAW